MRWIRWKPLKNPHSPARAVSTKCCKVGARPRNRKSFFGSGGGGPTISLKSGSLGSLTAAKPVAVNEKRHIRDWG